MATGIFYDKFPVSTGLLAPVSTLAGLLGLIGLVAFALLYRNSPTFRPIAFGIAFFLVGHSLESTVLPLDMYYEHRNYLPSFGIYFALVAGAQLVLPRLRPALATAVVVIYIGYFVALTHAKSVTWSERQFVYDAALERDYPSPRAAQGRAQLYLQNGQLAPALRNRLCFIGTTAGPEDVGALVDLVTRYAGGRI